jgi:hypothetical protein
MTACWLTAIATGENPTLYGDPAAERTYSAWIDHLAQRSDVDGSRIGAWEEVSAHIGQRA